MCRKIFDNLVENTTEYVDLCHDQTKRMCQIDARRLKLAVLLVSANNKPLLFFQIKFSHFHTNEQSGDLTNQGVKAAVIEMVERISREEDELADGYGSDIP